jgi:hypothetical protein
MKTILAVAPIMVLVAAAAWALTSSKPAGSPYTVEVRDVAGVSTLTVVPEVVASVPGSYVMPEVVARANLMPEIVVRALAVPEVAAVPAMGSEAVN